MNEAGPVTWWLERFREGDRAALDPLMQLVYEELRERCARLAGKRNRWTRAVAWGLADPVVADGVTRALAALTRPHE